MAEAQGANPDRLTAELAEYIARCYQCGKCSAGCPMATESELRPHTVMRLAVQGRREALLSDESLWLCLTCETCSARCPNDCDPAQVIDAVREIAAHEGRGPQQRNLRAFHRSFLEQIRLNGRLFEAGFMITYKMRSGALFQDATSAPSMISRGKLHPLPSRIHDIADVKRIFKRCEQLRDGSAPAADAAGDAP